MDKRFRAESLRKGFSENELMYLFTSRWMMREKSPKENMEYSVGKLILCKEIEKKSSRNRREEPKDL